MDDGVGSLRITVSGIRGKVPKGLNVSVASNFASAFGTYIEKGKVGVCMDGRWSGQILAHAVISSLSASGIEVSYYGVVPTPYLQFLISRSDLKGGISITGGHNPEDWNALILLNEKGSYLDSIEGNEVFNLYHSRDFARAIWDRVGRIKKQKPDFGPYLERIAELVNVKEIRRAKFKMVVDSCNGAGSVLIEEFAHYFNITCVGINETPGMRFPHEPEPGRENAQQVQAIMKAIPYDVGFVLNSDASRVSIITDTREALSEEYTLPLVSLSFLEKEPSPVITTIATSKLIEEVARSFRVPVIRTRVGQSSVIHTMEATRGSVGGEGSGSVSIRKFSPGYDSFLAMAFILNLMAVNQKSISDLIRDFPLYYMKKLKFAMPMEKIYRLIHHFKEVYSNERINLTDGIRVERKNGWFNLRASTTEFVLRVIVEATSKEEAERISDELIEKIWSFS